MNPNSKGRQNAHEGDFFWRWEKIFFEIGFWLGRNIVQNIKSLYRSSRRFLVFNFLGGEGGGQGARFVLSFLFFFVVAVVAAREIDLTRFYFIFKPSFSFIKNPKGRQKENPSSRQRRSPVFKQTPSVPFSPIKNEIYSKPL